MVDSAHSPPNPHDNQSEFAKLYRNSVREMWFSLALWFVTLFWTVGYCYLHGYQHSPDALVVKLGWATARTPEQLETVLGFPDWIFYGVIVPWGFATIVTIVYCGFAMDDDDLGGEQGETDELRTDV